MVRVREAEFIDLATLVRFNAEMAMETEALELEELRLVPGVQAVLSDTGKGQYYVAENEEIPVGQTLVTLEWSDWRNGYWWWLQSVYVLPDWRRKGVLRMLYNYIEEQARAAGAVGLRLYVDKENETARKAYTLLGMEASRYSLYENAF